MGEFDARFDQLARQAGAVRSRRDILKIGGGLAGLFLAAVPVHVFAQSRTVNREAAKWCADTFVCSVAEQCAIQATQGQGPYYQCGPGQPQPPQQAVCNGVCTNTSNNPQHCGTCGNACPSGQTCCNGACVNLSFDPQNCGACGNACASGSPCTSGFCESPPPVGCPPVPFCAPLPPDCPNIIQSYFQFGDMMCPGCRVCSL